jgi:hypothetical protein
MTLAGTIADLINLPGMAPHRRVAMRHVTAKLTEAIFIALIVAFCSRSTA